MKKQIRRKINHLTNRFKPGVLVLLYHRVARLINDPLLLNVTPEHFEEHLEIIKEFVRPMKLQDLVKGIHAGEIPHRAIVITFDDGYVDNLRNAVPLLEKYDVPATIFVPSGYVNAKREFWWDELEYLLFKTEKLPELNGLNLNDKIQPSDLTNAYQVLAQPEGRTLFYQRIHQLLRPLNEDYQQYALTEISNWVGIERELRDDNRCFLEAEAESLAKDGLVEIGAHTVTHPQLSAMPEDIQEQEIVAGKLCLEEVLGRQIRSFAYPYGVKSTDYTNITADLVKQAGFDCACSVDYNIVRKDANLFQLPRPVVRDWDGDTFFGQIQKWFKGKW